MVSKTITVVEQEALVANEDGYGRLLSKYGVRFLVYKDQIQIRDFESLVDGETYALGSPLAEETQNSVNPPATNIEDTLMQEVWVRLWKGSGALGKRLWETLDDSNPNPTKKAKRAPSPHDAKEEAAQDTNQKTDPTENPPQQEATALSTDEANDANEPTPPQNEEEEAAQDLNQQTEPTKKPPQQNDANEPMVEVFPPGKGGNWYLGEQGAPFYLRRSVENMLRFVLTDIKVKEQMEGNSNAEGRGAGVYVISGAAGIGKSWSINAFMTALCGAGMNIFFYSGFYLRAWKIHSNGRIEHGVAPTQIQSLDKEWLYVYDSPGARAATTPWDQARPRKGGGKVTLIFSSPKAVNYQYATGKGDDPVKILHLPSWTKAEMLEIYTSVTHPNQAEAVGASYSAWGGNMRAFAQFKDGYQKDAAEAVKKARKDLDTHIRKIDEAFAEKMVSKLEKQDVEGKFSGEDVHNTPGHILTPEPTVTDPEDDGCFEEFHWRFCSPLAEKKFWQHVRTLGHSVLKKLLLRVFQTPSPKGVLFEKIAHTMLTNGVVGEFRCYPYKKGEEKKETVIAFLPCERVLSFGGDKDLEKALSNAREILKDKDGAVALEPEDTSYDSVDMFVLEKKQATAGAVGAWVLHMLQDTISKTHTFHPVKILWYCTLFRKVFNEEVKGNSLPCWKYVVVVPHETQDFRFKVPKSSSSSDELRDVAELLRELGARNIPAGRRRKKVDEAKVLREAKDAVLEKCQVIFDVVNTA